MQCENDCGHYSQMEFLEIVKNMTTLIVFLSKKISDFSDTESFIQNKVRRQMISEKLQKIAESQK